MLKSISASVIFREYPEVKQELWGGEFWEDGYFVRTVGDKVTADVIRKYIKYHREQEMVVLSILLCKIVISQFLKKRQVVTHFSYRV